MLVNFKSKTSCCIINVSELVSLKYYERVHVGYNNPYRCIGATMKDGSDIVVFDEEELAGCNGHKVVEWIFEEMAKLQSNFETIDISDCISQKENMSFGDLLKECTE